MRTMSRGLRGFGPAQPVKQLDRKLFLRVDRLEREFSA